MSVQLILYPQNQVTTTEFLVNGISFNDLNNTTSYAANGVVGFSTPSDDAVANSPATTLNTWYRYYTNAGGWGSVATPANGFPVPNTGVLWFFYAVTPARSGIYQRLSGLTIGQSYTVTVNIAAAAVGTLRIRTYSGPMFLTTYSASTNTTQVSTTFTASTNNDTVLIEYESTTANLSVNSISVTSTSVTPPDQYEGQVKSLQIFLK